MSTSFDPFKPFGEQGLDTVRLSEKQWDTLFSQLNSSKQRFAGPERRTKTRKRYQHNLQIIVRVEHPGGSNMTFKVRSRDLSINGVGFVHGSFIYPNRPITIILPTVSGGMAAIRGTVRRCQLLSGKLHEVGVEFGETIELSEFIQEPVPEGKTKAVAG